MALPYSEYILRCYHYRRWCRSAANVLPQTLTNENTIESGNTNILSVRVDISKDVIEVPCYCMDVVFPYLVEKIKYPDVYDDVLYYPVYNNVESSSYNRRGAPKTEYKSVSPAIKAFLFETNTAEGIRKIKIGDDYYYGGKGLILYGDMTPACMLSLELEKIQVKTRSDTVYRLHAVRPIIKVNPKVYQREDLMSKHIKQKFIQEALCIYFNVLDSHVERSRPQNLFVNEPLKEGFKIIIDNFDEDFSRPGVPNADSTPENINTFLNEFSNNIVNSI